MHALIFLLERLFRRGFLRTYDLIHRIFTVAMWWWPFMTSAVIFVVGVIFTSGISRYGLQSAALHRLKGASSLRCHSRHLWVRRVNIRIFNELFPFKEVILELFEGFWGSQSRLIDFFHFFPYLFNREIDKILSGPSLASISKVLRITIALNWVGRVLLLVHKINSFSASASSCWLGLKQWILF